MSDGRRSMGVDGRSPEITSTLLEGEAEAALETDDMDVGEQLRSPRVRLERLLSVAGGQLLAGLVLVALWWAMVELGLVKELVARTPKEVWDALWALLSGGELWSHLRSTVSATLVAFALASVIGVFIGISIALMPTLERLIEPYLSFLNAIPRTVFAPIFIIYFGLGQGSKVALAFTIVIFVMIINTRAGVRGVDPDIITMARVMGLSKPELFWKVLLPGAVPSIFAGLWLGAIYSLLGVVTAEIISSKEGLGQLVASDSSVFYMEGVYAVVIILGLVGMALNMVMSAAERYFLRWKIV